MADDLNCAAFKADRTVNSESGDMPDSDDNTSVFLMAVDPCLVHVVWQVAHDDLRKVKQQCGGDLSNGLFAFQFFDAEHDSSGKSGLSALEVPIDLDDKKCYVPLQEAGKSYFTELGFKTAGGDFFTIARSNIAETPQKRPVYKIPEQKEQAACEPELIPASGAKSAESIRDNGGEIARQGVENVAPASLDLQGKSRLARILNNQYIDAIEVLKNPDAISPWSFERRDLSLSPAGPAFCGCPDHWVHGSAYDLTEMAERKFVYGVSSTWD